MTCPSVEIKDVSFSFNSENLLKKINLTVNPNEKIGILGENGSGKTTLINIISGLIKPDTGSVYILGNPVHKTSHKKRALLLSRVSQSNYASLPYTVEQVVSFGRYPHTSLIKPLSKTDMQKIEHALEKTGIAHLRKRKITELSGGEKQKVFIAKAVAQDTPVMLLDEPDAHLDPPQKGSLAEIIKNLKNKACIVVSHDVSFLSATCDKIYILISGSLEPVTEDSFDKIKRAFKDKIHIERDKSTGLLYTVPLCGKQIST